jgi:hypothetical protein
MLKKYVSKFTMDVLPSVIATIIGAYIVNHYIVARPGAGADAPVAAALSPADPKKADVRNDASDVANIPEPGVRAKGFSEKTTIERAAVVEKPAEKPVEKSAEKPAEKPAETASIPADTRRHLSAPREKTVARTVPAPVAPAIAPVVAPVVSAPNPAPPVEAAVVPEDRRDANDLARAAIERLRGSNESAPRAQEAARIPEPVRQPDAPRVVSAPSVSTSAPQVRPLPPPIMVSTPTAETFEPTTGSVPMKPPYAAARIDDPLRPTPPADIPASRPLDLHAEAADPATREHTNVAEDMLSAAKSVFHAVLPK